MEPRRVLIANACPLTGPWIAATLRTALPRGWAGVLVGDGVDLLYHLAERGPFELVVTSAALPGIAGTQVLAMARTAGLRTPFVVTAVVADDALRRLIHRAAPAELVDDALDATVLRGAVRRLAATSGPPGGRAQWRKAFAIAGAPRPPRPTG